MIYAVQAAIGGPVKIGFTCGDTIDARLASLQAACPWPLLIVRMLPGSVRDELELHRRFARQRLHGEWFEPVGPVLEWLQAERIQIRATVNPDVEPLVGPLPAPHVEVLDALAEIGDWARAKQVADRIGSSVPHTSGLLRALHRKFGRVLVRRAVANGRGVYEWRPSWSHPGRTAAAESGD